MALSTFSVKPIAKPQSLASRETHVLWNTASWGQNHWLEASQLWSFQKNLWLAAQRVLTAPSTPFQRCICTCAYILIEILIVFTDVSTAGSNILGLVENRVRNITEVIPIHVAREEWTLAHGFEVLERFLTHRLAENRFDRWIALIISWWLQYTHWHYAAF